jgi:Rrf2 family nitric oxide-sensitive transcriptional repressor
MKLTRFTDYSLRVLMHLGLNQGRLCSIAEIAKANRVSENHLTKVVHHLGQIGLVTTVRGRGGGMRLALAADKISVGGVVRQTEEGFDLLDCEACLLTPACVLTGALAKAVCAFLAVLDGYTIADLIKPGDRLRALLQIAPLEGAAQYSAG